MFTGPSLARPPRCARPLHAQVEERKNSHINALMKQHEAAFAEVKNYYNDITANNLDLIKARRGRKGAPWGRGEWPGG